MFLDSHRLITSSAGLRYAIAAESYTYDSLFKADLEAVRSFESQIDKWLSGEMKSDEYFELGKTPIVLKALGAKDLPIIMSQNVMVKITGEKHSISLDDIKSIPDAISDPVMIFKSNTVSDAFIILTELTDKSGSEIEWGNTDGFTFITESGGKVTKKRGLFGNRKTVIPRAEAVADGEMDFEYTGNSKINAFDERYAGVYDENGNEIDIYDERYYDNYDLQDDISANSDPYAGSSKSVEDKTVALTKNDADTTEAILEDTSSIEPEKDISEYSAEKQRVIAEYAAYKDENLRKFIDASLENEPVGKKYYLENVGDEAADKIEELTGVNVHGFKTAFEDRMVKHIDKGHGAKGITDHSMKNRDDFERIQYVLNNYDTIEYGGTSSAYTTIKKNGFPADAKTVVYKKAINGTYYVVEAVPDTKNKTVNIVTAYIEKGTAARTMQNARSFTSETSSADSLLTDIGTSTSVNNSIPQNGVGVKGETRGYGKSGAKLFNEIFEAEQISETELKPKFQRAYETGFMGIEDASFSDSIEQRAYEAGKADYAESLNRAIAESKNFVVSNNGGLVKNNAAKKVSSWERKLMNEIGKALGVKLKYAEQVSGGKANGVYQGGKITIALDAVNKYFDVAKHEITHHMKVVSPREYFAFRNHAVQILSGERGVSYTTLIESYQNSYANGGVNLTIEEAMDEIASDFTKRILTNESDLREFLESMSETREKRGIVQRFFDAVHAFLEKIKKVFNGNKAQMDSATLSEFGATVKQLERAEQLWKDALRTTAERVKNAKPGEADNTANTYTAKPKYSFAGRKSKTADKTMLEKAMDLEKSGEGSESIRKKTGWHKGYDGKWRYEIDDSKMEFSKTGAFQNPDTERKNVLELKFIEGAITDSEIEELRALTNTTKGLTKPTTLRSFIKHDELFQAYPFLKNIKVYLVDNLGANGQYNEMKRRIKLNSSLTHNQLKHTLTHEIQRAIQGYEDFARGIDLENYKFMLYLSNKIDAKSLFNKISQDKRIKDIEEKFNKGELTEEEYKAEIERTIESDPTLKAWHEKGLELLDYDNEELQKKTTIKYYTTAGEIEARDAASRIDMTSEQRKNTRPDIDKTYVVFADDHINYSIVEPFKDENGNDFKNAVPITKADIEAVQSLGEKSVNDFSSSDIKNTEAFARKYFSEIGTKSPFFRSWFGDWRANDTTKIKIVNQKSATRGIHKNTDTGWNINVSGKVFNESRHEGPKNKAAMPYLEYIDSIVESAVLLDSYTMSKGKLKSENSAMMHSMYVLADIGNGTELIKLYVEELRNVNTDGTIKRSYQLQNISAIKNSNPKVQSSGNNLSSINQTANVVSVADLFQLVKTYDKKFSPKSVNPLLLNEDGTPKILYHGTDAEFNTFDMTKGRANMDIQGAFFSPYEIDAAGYGKNIYACYLNIRNPANESSAYKALNMFKGQNNAGIKAREYLIKQGYDGVYNGYDEYIAFYPAQIKSATDNIGTFDGENADIRYSLKNQTDLLTENAKLREVNEALRKEFEVTKVAKVDEKSLNAFTKGLLKEYGSVADEGKIKGLLDELFTYIANGEDGIVRIEKLISAMVDTASRAGQVLQASRLLKKMTPDFAEYKSTI